MDRNFARHIEREHLIGARAATDAILYRAALGDRIEFSSDGRPVIDITSGEGNKIFMATSSSLGGINEFEISAYLASFARTLEALLEKER